MTVCRSCGQEIRWVVMASTGKRMPLDPDPNFEKGNVAFIEGGEHDSKAMTLGGPILDQARATQKDALYVSHFATCPQAAKHRRK